MLARFSKGRGQDSPIVISSRSRSASQEAIVIESSADEDDSSPDSLGAALERLQATKAPGKKTTIRRQPAAGSSHGVHSRTASRADLAPRPSSSRVDETLVNGKDYSDRKRRKRRLQAPEAGQTTLTQISGLRRQDGTHSRGISTTDGTRVKTEGRRRSDGLASTSRHSITSTVGRTSSSASRGTLARNSSGGTSATDPIIIGNSDDESLQPPVGESPRSVQRKPSISPTRSSEFGSQIRRSATPTKRGRLGSLFPDDEDDPTIGERAAEALSQRPKRRSQSRVLVPETVLEDSSSKPETGAAGRDQAHTTPPKPQRSRADTMRNPFLVPETPEGPAESANVTDSLMRKSSDSNLVRSPLEEKNTANGNSASPFTPKAVNKPLHLSSPQSTLLDGLARSPTPKKKMATKQSHLPSAARIKRPFTNLISEDDESWRPPPGTKAPRSAASRLHVTPPAAAGRPRRVNTAPGKYTLPPVDTPIHLWPTKPAAQPTTSTSRKRRTLPRSKLAASPVTPQRNRGSRSREQSSPLTPLPETQVPDRADRQSSQDSESDTDIDQPADPGPIAGTGSGDGKRPDNQAAAPAMDEEHESGDRADELDVDDALTSDEDAEVAESVLDLAEYAEFANMKFSPAPSSQGVSTPRRNGTPLGASPSRSIGKRLSKSPLAHMGSLPTIQEGDDNSPTRQKPSKSPRISPPQEEHAPEAPEETLTTRLLREQEEEARLEAEIAERARREARERQDRLRAQLQAAQDTEEEDDDEEPSLSQILRSKESDKELRRSARTKSMATNAAVIGLSPKETIDPSAQAFARLMRETKKEERSGATRNILEAMDLGPQDDDVKHETSTEEEDEDQSDVDMDHLRDVDEDMLAHVEAVRAERSLAHSVDVETPNWAFWTAEEPQPCESSPGASDDYVLATLLSASSSYVPGSAGDVTVTPSWLFDTIFATADEQVALIALDQLVEALSSASENPFVERGLINMAEGVWQSRGGKISASEADPPVVRRERQTSSALLCQIVRCATTWVTEQDATTLLRYLSLLLADSTTSPALAREISHTIDRLIPLASQTDALSIASVIATPLVALSKATKSKTVLALGQASDSSRQVVRWVAMLLLLPDCADYVKDALIPPVSLLELVLKNLCHAVTQDRGTGDRVEYSSLGYDLVLWSAAASDIPALVRAASETNETHPLELLSTLTILRNSIRDSDQDCDTSAIKTRLHQIAEIIHWKSEHESASMKRRRMEGKGLELGVGAQTRLSLGR